MKTINMDAGNGTITFVPIEISLTIRGAVRFVAEINGDDLAPLCDLAFAQGHCDGRDPVLGDYNDLGAMDVAVVQDDEKKTFYLVMGDTQEDEHDILLSAHYQGQGEGGSLFINLGGERLKNFWRRAGAELRVRKDAATGVDAEMLNLTITALRFISGEDVDLAPAFNGWTEAAGRSGGVQILSQFMKKVA
ncbi:hypothetical protein [Sphingobium fuliginis]|jgi:hypothetical protein|uniref:hypothetical protein n=1 Tax=Sphingobium fuliginis (strain ATCC 27551) TaxID=336203 RepID=UPI0037CB22FA